MDALVLAETLAARLCHDLSGELSALTGAMELLREEAAADPEALELASDAGLALTRRLRLARAAWGRTGGPMAIDEWRCLAEGLARRGVELHLDGVSGRSSFAAEAARLTLNVLLLAVEALPAGGVVEATGEAHRDIIVRIQGPRAAWPEGLATMLAEPEAAMARLRSRDAGQAARTLQAPLTALIAHATGQRVSLLFGARPEIAPPLLLNLLPLA